MKIMICTTPIRPIPTSYPPFGSLAVIQALRGAGYDPVFLDIDGLRPSFPEVVERLRRDAPDILGIGAVVSTAYGYVKDLCKAVKEVLPGTKIVLGGNLAASAELLHRFCKVHVCVIGEGEKIIVNLANYYVRHPKETDYSELAKIKGITYLDACGDMIFTGYETAIRADELFDPDFSILEKYSNINNFIDDPFTRSDFSRDPRSYEPHRAGKKMGTVVSTKGCVARCTFCHRWDKGFRQIRPEKVIGRIRYLMDRYNAGFICFGDENFGSDRRAAHELIRLIKPLDIIWQVGGIRACTLDPELLKAMHDAGCVAVYYGFESGSPEILEVMEKKLELEHNLNATRWTYEAGLFTIYQLVLGMPGETPSTVRDTIEMVKQITEFLPDPPSKCLSPNFIQALPGTPVYEYARSAGLIGPTLEDEEAYLLSVSDVDAGDDTRFLNFTNYPYLTVQSWRPRLMYEATVHWHRVRTRQHRVVGEAPESGAFRAYKQGGYFNLQTVGRNPTLFVTLYPLRWLIIWAWTLRAVFRRSTKLQFFTRLLELLTWPLKTSKRLADYRSLRHIMRDVATQPETQTEKSMMPLRLGR